MLDSNTPLEYEYKTKPYEHQRKLLEETWDREYYAVLWEMGCGKSLLILDNVSVLYLKGLVNCLIVIAPNGVHRNWIAEEIEKHLPDKVMADVKAFAYHSSKAKTKRHQKAAEEVIAHRGLSVVAMSYEAFVTKAGKAFAKDVLTKRECFYVLDESTRIKNPNAKRTRTILASAKYGKYRRILSGTPVTNSIFELYSQFKFLDKDFWKLGYGNYTLFKNYFAVWEKGYNSATGNDFPILVEYRNVEELHDVIQPYSSRVLKCDVLDLPPKIFSKRFFDMSVKQSQLYKTLRDEFVAELDEGSVSADLAIVRMIRLQQIVSGHVAIEEKVTPDPENPDYIEYVSRVVDIEDTNNRLKLLEEIIEDTEGKIIIWARFVKDIDSICELLGDKAVRYDGKVKTDDRAIAIDSFQHGKYKDARFFVASAQAAGEGLTLTAANTVIYYSNTFSLGARLQSEDRCHRIGTTKAVNYIDIVANESIDEHIINALINKLDMARMVTGDAIREWL